jgi:hypothetical protein
MQNEEFSENAMMISEEFIDMLDKRGLTSRQALFICVNASAMLISTSKESEQWHQDSGLLLRKLVNTFRRVLL